MSHLRQKKEQTLDEIRTMYRTIQDTLKNDHEQGTCTCTCNYSTCN